MKRRSILSGQSVKKKNSKKNSDFSGIFHLLFSVSVKVIFMFVGMISVSLLFLYLYQCLVTSPYIRLEKVKILGGNETIKRELIKMSGLDNEVSLLTMNLDALKQKMEKDPWVRSVELEKRFPHTLIVKVDKERPYAIVALDKLYYIDRWGTPFKEINFEDNKDFPVITGIPLKSNNRNKYLKEAVEILSSFGSDTGPWSMNNLSELHFNESGRVSLYSTLLPVELKLGDSELALKKEELKKILAHLKKTGQIHLVKIIDLNYTDGAVVSFRNAG